MSNTSELKKGAVIRHQNDLFVVAFTNFVNPGKGSAFTRVKMKSITSGKTLEVTFKSGESVDIVEVDNQKMQYLYKNGNFYSFMNQDTFENYDIESELIGDDVKYLKEGLEVWGIIFEGRVVAVKLPPKVKYTVAEAPPAVKGDTVSSGRMMKEATMENGLVVKVPIFIKQGDVVLVNTEEGEYCEKINE